MDRETVNTDAIKALCTAQAAMPKAVKDSRNPHFDKTYESLAAVQDACLPHLHENGFAVTHFTGRDDEGWYLETSLWHEGGGNFSCRIPLIVDKKNMQGFKSAVTYARRIGLGCLSGVAPEDDDGNNAAAAPPPQRTREVPPPDQDYDPKAVADRLLKALKHTADGDLGKWKATNLDEMDRLKRDAPLHFEAVLDACKSRAKQNETEE